MGFHRNWSNCYATCNLTTAAVRTSSLVSARFRFSRKSDARRTTRIFRTQDWWNCARL